MGSSQKLTQETLTLPNMEVIISLTHKTLTLRDMEVIISSILVEIFSHLGVQPKVDPGHDDQHTAGDVDGDEVVGELPLEHQVH